MTIADLKRRLVLGQRVYLTHCLTGPVEPKKLRVVALVQSNAVAFTGDGIGPGHGKSWLYFPKAKHLRETPNGFEVMEEAREGIVVAARYEWAAASEAEKTVATVTPDVATRVRAKLCPDRMKVSPKFTAILGYLCEAEPAWTSPALVEMQTTSDGAVLGRREGDIGLNEFIGSAVDLKQNLCGVSDAAGLLEDERKWLWSQHLYRCENLWRNAVVVDA